MKLITRDAMQSGSVGLCSVDDSDGSIALHVQLAVINPTGCSVSFKL